VTTLHKDTGTARRVVRTLNEISRELDEMLRQAVQEVNYLQEGVWYGDSAEEFYYRFSDWRGRVQQSIYHLGSLAQSLNQEIIRWESIAQNLE